jgi:hypothetical protein
MFYFLFVEYRFIGFNCFNSNNLVISGIVFDKIACIIQLKDCSFLLTVAAKIPKKLKYFLVLLIMISFLNMAT